MKNISNIHFIIHGHYGDYLLLEISCMIFLSHISWKTYLVSLSILCPLKPPTFIHVPAVGQVWLVAASYGAGTGDERRLPGRTGCCLAAA